jgi:hypothetical protein
MMKPFSTGSEMKLARKPIFARPAASASSPVTIASAVVSATNSGAPGVASSATMLADSAAVADIVATTRIRDEPKTAYRMSAGIAA